MNRTEQERGMICTAVLSGEVGRQEAAVWLGLSERQVRRVLAAYGVEGPAGLVHGNRGRAPVQTLSMEVRERIVRLADGRYAGVNDTHLSELLARDEGITVSRSTVRRVRGRIGLAPHPAGAEAPEPPGTDGACRDVGANRWQSASLAGRGGARLHAAGSDR